MAYKQHRLERSKNKEQKNTSQHECVMLVMNIEASEQRTSYRRVTM